MAFERFTSTTASGAYVQRLLVAGAGAAFGVVTIAIAAGHLVKPQAIKLPDLEEQVEVPVNLVEEPPAPEPEPEPAAPEPPVAAAPPPLVVPKNIQVAAKVEPVKPPDVPLEIPKGPLAEDDPSKDKGVAGVHEGEVGQGKAGGLVGGKGNVVGAKATVGTGTVAAPPTPKPVAPKPTIAVAPEGSEPAICSGLPQPKYPDSARNAGIEGDVIVKCLVVESGDLQQCKVLKGDPVFHDAVLASVTGFRCKQPFTLEGRPIAAGKVFKFKMKINQ